MPEARGGPLPFMLTGTICRQSLAPNLDDARAFLNREGGEEEPKEGGSRVHGAGFGFLPRFKQGVK